MRKINIRNSLAICSKQCSVLTRTLCLFVCWAWAQRAHAPANRSAASVFFHFYIYIVPSTPTWKYKHFLLRLALASFNQIFRPVNAFHAHQTTADAVSSDNFPKSRNLCSFENGRTENTLPQCCSVCIIYKHTAHYQAESAGTGSCLASNIELLCGSVLVTAICYISPKPFIRVFYEMIWMDGCDGIVLWCVVHEHGHHSILQTLSFIFFFVRFCPPFWGISLLSLVRVHTVHSPRERETARH